MSKIEIVIETGSDVSKELAAELGVHLVPMYVTFDGVDREDGSFPRDEVVAYYQRTGKVPKTSGAAMIRFEELFDEIHKKDPEAQILYLAYSSVTTCSYTNANLAAEGRDYVRLVDTKQVSIGECAAVTLIVRAIKAHPEWSIDECAKAAEEISAGVHMGFVPDNLDFLRAGGRVSNAAALCGNLLGLHPLIDIRDGYLKADKKYRGKTRKILPVVLREYVERYRLDTKELWFGYTPLFTDECMEIAMATLKELGCEKINIVLPGCVITTHGGTGAFTLAGRTLQ